MDCPRCKGVMTQEVFEDLLDDTGNLCFKGWRCLLCGEILDPVIPIIADHILSLFWVEPGRNSPLK